MKRDRCAIVPTDKEGYRCWISSIGVRGACLLPAHCERAVRVGGEWIGAAARATHARTHLHTHTSQAPARIQSERRSKRFRRTSSHTHTFHRRLPLLARRSSRRAAPYLAIIPPPPARDPPPLSRCSVSTRSLSSWASWPRPRQLSRSALLRSPRRAAPPPPPPTHSAHPRPPCSSNPSRVDGRVSPAR